MTYPANNDPALSIGILLLDRFNLMSVSNFIDVLRLAADKGVRGKQRNCSWQMLAPGENRVHSSCGISLQVEKFPPQPQQFDYLAIFGDIPEDEYFLDDRVQAYIRQAHRSGLTLIGIGGGTAALVETGLTADMPVCVHWYHHDDYIRVFGEIALDAECLYREERNIITCAGGAAATDLAISLIQRHLGSPWANKCQRMLLLDEVRKPGHLQSVPVHGGTISCEMTKRAVRTIERRLDEPIRIDDLAKSLNIGRRQLERKFRAALGKGIHEFTRDLRLQLASETIRNSNRTILDIALSCGFPTVEHFNNTFKARFGCTPTQMRQKGPLPPEPAMEGLTPARSGPI